MGVINIRKARRSGARLVIGLCGRSGDGKTVTAIHLAYGLANYDASKVGFLDTENRRGSLNAHVLQTATRPTDEPFFIGDLYAPFSPQRYADAIHEFQDAGVEVLIVDSVTHEWEGIGGCQEIAGDDNKYWNKAKRLHRTPFMSALLQSDMHIIACVRARPKVEMKKNSQGKTEYIDLGVEPVQEKNFMFELTASLMMCNEGRNQIGLKIPGDLREILGRGEGYISADDGKAIREWVDGADPVDPKVEKCRNGLISNAEGGVQHLKALWDQVPTKYQNALGKDFYAMVMKSAAEFDQMKLEADEAGVGGDGKDSGAEIAGIAAAGAARQSVSAAAGTPATTQPSSGTAVAKSEPQESVRTQVSPPTASAQTTGASRTPVPAQSANRTPRPANHPPPATVANRNAVTARPTATNNTAQAPAGAAKDDALF